MLRFVGRNPSVSKHKGFIEVHIQIIMQERVPRIVWFSKAKTPNCKINIVMLKF
jgi:hypothetical protein